MDERLCFDLKFPRGICFKMKDASKRCMRSQVENWEEEVLTGPACFPFIRVDVMESVRSQDTGKESGGERLITARVNKQSCEMLNNEK